MADVDFSIVVPAFNEAGKIHRDVTAAGEFFLAERLAGEVIVVDDGSTDGTADEARGAELADGVARKVIRCEANRGKGFAVRAGMAATRGRRVMFADSGLCVDFKYALLGVDMIEAGQCDIAHGSRRLDLSHIRQHQKPHRRLMGRLFRWAGPHLIGLPPGVTDSQCGFKVYRGDVARELYAACICDGFMFDVETILRAAGKGYRLAEFPVLWHSDHDSRLRTLHVSLKSFSELIAIKRALRKA